MNRIQVTKGIIGVCATAAFILTLGIAGNSDLEMPTEKITYIMLAVVIVIIVIGALYYNLLNNRMELSRRAKNKKR